MYALPVVGGMHSEFVRVPERFEIRRLLGEGGMGVVYEAWDRERESPVALKTLRASEPQLITRLKREFRALADVQHPNLVRLGELFSVEGEWFFTMELLENAQDVLSYIRAANAQKSSDAIATADTINEALAVTQDVQITLRPQDVRLRSALRQIALGLCALHAAGKVHRDLKPSNILVVPTGRTVVVDFGLVADLVGERSSEANIVGTALYMAPEQAASQRPGPAADWYSLGAVLYEALTGCPPHDGDVLQVLMEKQTRDPLPPRVLNAQVPRDLDELCMQLLRRDPLARPSGRQVVEALGAAVEPSDAAPTPRSSHDEPLFVGRTTYLDELQKSWETVVGGVAAFVAIVGESGVGKSALARQFLATQKVGDSPPLVARGRCYERETVPYKGFDGIVDALTNHIEEMNPLDAATVLPSDAALLVRVLPAFRRLPAFARAHLPVHASAAPHDQRTRAFKAFRELLTKLCAYAPLILYVDDFHWTDPDGLLLFEELLRAPYPPRCLVVATMRASTAGESVLRRIADACGSTKIVSLEPLDDSEAMELARRLLASANQQTIDRLDEIVREAGGHPLFVQELVRQVEANAAGTVEPSRKIRLDEVVWERVQRMDSTASRLVELIAVAGAPIPQHIVARASGLSRDQAMGVVSQLRATNLVRTEGATARDVVAPYHDRIREAVLARLDGDVLRAHHIALAQALEAEGHALPPQRLIAHLVAAGEQERAANAAELAGRQSDESLAFDQAAELYALALRLREHNVAKRTELLLACGSALANAGRGPEAGDAFQQAALLSSGATRLSALQRAAEHLLGSGHIARGRAVLDTLLAEIGERPPTTSAGVLRSLAWHRLVIRLRGYRWKRREESDIPASELDRIQIYRSVAVGLAHVDTMRAADYQSRGLVRALRLGEPNRVSRALALEAGFLASEGTRRSKEAFALLETARTIARELGDRTLNAFQLGLETVMCVCTGQFARAPALAIECEQMAGGRMTQWEINPIRMFHIRSLRFMGELAKLETFATDYARDASRRGDEYMRTGVAYALNIVSLARGDTETAAQELGRRPWEGSEHDFHVQHLQRVVAEGELSLCTDTVARKHEELRERLRRFMRSTLRRVQIVRCEAMWIRGRMALAAASESGQPEELIAEAASASKALRAEGVGYASAWDSLLRSAIHLRRGSEDAALGALHETTRHAEASALNLIAAVVNRREGEIIGGSEGERLVSQANERMRSLGVIDTDGITRLYAPGFRPR